MYYLFTLGLTTADMCLCCSCLLWLPYFPFLSYETYINQAIKLVEQFTANNMQLIVKKKGQCVNKHPKSKTNNNNIVKHKTKYIQTHELIKLMFVFYKFLGWDWYATAFDINGTTPDISPRTISYYQKQPSAKSCTTQIPSTKSTIHKRFAHQIL